MRKQLLSSKYEICKVDPRYKNFAQKKHMGRTEKLQVLSYLKLRAKFLLAICCIILKVTLRVHTEVQLLA